MNTPTPADKPDAKSWIIAAGALFFCLVIAPGLAEFASSLVR